jgi:hypothetical protein
MKNSPRRVRPWRLGLVLAALAVLAPSASAQALRRSGPPSVAASLRRVVSPSRGLPGFGPNALEGIFAEYKVIVAAGSGGAATVFVWASREAVWFDPAVWKGGTVASRRSLGRQAPPGDAELPPAPAFTLVAFDRPFAAGGLGALPEQWSVLVALPEGGLDGQAYESFMAAFLDRFSYFLSLARSPDDASFPAIVER